MTRNTLTNLWKWWLWTGNLEFFLVIYCALGLSLCGEEKWWKIRCTTYSKKSFFFLSLCVPISSYPQMLLQQLGDCKIFILCHDPVLCFFFFLNVLFIIIPAFSVHFILFYIILWTFLLLLCHILLLFDRS